jgi:hypothetical protein
VLLVLAAVGVLGGCAQERPTEARVQVVGLPAEGGATTPAGAGVRGYAGLFAAAKGVLRDNDFRLDRVDARLGVLTSRSKGSGGVLTPWDGEQTTMTQEMEDLLNRQARAVRVTFEPAGAPPTGGSVGTQPEDLDLRTWDGPLTVRVEVALLRRQRPHWRVQTAAIRLSNYAQEPALSERGMQPEYSVAFDQDDLLAGRLLAEILPAWGEGEPGGP